MQPIEIFIAYQNMLIDMVEGGNGSQCLRIIDIQNFMKHLEISEYECIEDYNATKILIRIKGINTCNKDIIQGLLQYHVFIGCLVEVLNWN